MKSNKITFLLSEIILGLLLLLCVFLIFSDEKPQKRVAVIVERSGDENGIHLSMASNRQPGKKIYILSSAIRMK